MWKTATLMSAAGVVVAIIGTEFLRAAVDKHRTRTQGMGGTQDILLIGMIVGWSCFFAAIGFGIKWWMTAQ
ncbi:hypothetical protein VSU19_00225 [Verrucomicrobiales bacterium BCK34]|nr:hypothetical protein [Verrucomicrobiales bacterium BCK34]